MALPERGTVAALHPGIEGGMADKGAGDAVLREEGNLERQQRHDVIEPLLSLRARNGPQAQSCGAT